MDDVNAFIGAPEDEDCSGVEEPVDAPRSDRVSSPLPNKFCKSFGPISNISCASFQDLKIRKKKRTKIPP